MGRGNWFPGRHIEDCSVVYVNFYDDEMGDDPDRQEWAWEDLRETLGMLLPKSFFESDDRNCDRDSVAMFSNGLFTLWSDGQGDAYHMGLGFTVRGDAPAFAASKLDSFAESFWDKLQELYPLSVRTSAWTSATRMSSAALTARDDS